MSRVANARATMASRVEDDRSLDYFPSPPWWGRALGEALDRLGLPGRRSCEEPAAGEGHLAHGLRDVFAVVQASDVHRYPRRRGALEIVQSDYLAPRWRSAARRAGTVLPDWTATNPPFGDRTEPFIRRAVACSGIGAAMLLQLGLLEGKDRLALFRDCGLYATVVLPRKGSGLRKGLWQPGLSTATRYAWFIFVSPGRVPGWAGFDGEARQIWMDWDAAKRLTRDSDAAFAGLAR